ncbi:hypothetical protein F5Y16DRAFT_381309 [Xylariaceae sp. FL0255]|nr:hypothetical protein F5Y16DRAFT_381309 [Xylariaceae sp. FL0255]
MGIELLKRLLRYYQATNVISQVDDEAYQSSSVSHALSSDNHGDSLRFTQNYAVKVCCCAREYIPFAILHRSQRPQEFGILPIGQSRCCNPDSDNPDSGNNDGELDACHVLGIWLRLDGSQIPLRVSIGTVNGLRHILR